MEQPEKTVGNFFGTLSELNVDGGEGEHHVEVVLHTVEEVVPQDRGRRIFTLLANFLHVDSLALNRDQILVFLAEQTWDFTSGKHRVDSFEEGLRLDFGVSHQEADRATLRAGDVVKTLDIVEHGAKIIRLGQSNLEEFVTADVGGKSGERGLTRATNTDKHSATSISVHSAGQSEQMGESVVEDDEGHLLGRVLLVVLVELGSGNVLDVLVALTSFVHERSLLNDFTIFVDDVIAHKVSELEIGKNLRLIEVVEFTEFLFGDAIEDILEGLLVCVVDELINKSALALVAPEANHE